jgi:hypothetical protein
MFEVSIIEHNDVPGMHYRRQDGEDGGQGWNEQARAGDHGALVRVSQKNYR